MRDTQVYEPLIRALLGTFLRCSCSEIDGVGLKYRDWSTRLRGWVPNVEWRDQALGGKAQGLEVLSARREVCGLGCRVQGSDLRAQGSGCRLQGSNVEA